MGLGPAGRAVARIDRPRFPSARQKAPLPLERVSLDVKRLQKRYGCPVEFTLDCLGGKWKTVILAHLKGGPLRYADLRQRVRPMADKVLNERLLELQAAGLVGRDTTTGTYALSERGQSLGPVLQALYDWGQGNAQAMAVNIKPTEVPDDP